MKGLRSTGLPCLILFFLLTNFCVQSLQRDVCVSYLNPNESRNKGLEVKIMQRTIRKTLITDPPVNN